MPWGFFLPSPRAPWVVRPATGELLLPLRADPELWNSLGQPLKTAGPNPIPIPFIAATFQLGVTMGHSAGQTDKRKHSLLRVPGSFCYRADFLLPSDGTNTDVRGGAFLTNWRPRGRGRDHLRMGPLNQKISPLFV